MKYYFNKLKIPKLHSFFNLLIESLDWVKKRDMDKKK